MPVGAEAKMALTGNPFVDTGLAVVAALAKLDEVENLGIDDIRAVHGEGDQIASWNSRLKSFSQIFGTNNPLFQTGYGYKKGKGPSGRNYAIYRATLNNFLEAFDGGSGQLRCESCGVFTEFDFARSCIKAVEDNGAEAPEDKWVGRDWFPLAGSIGSDAQALPAASRTVHLCARCLFAVHYLPLGLILLDGRLAVFQSTSVEFWYELVRDIVDEVQGRIKAGNFETLGAKEGSRILAKRLLGLFERLQTATRFGDIPPGTALQVWRFTNSGASPECGIEEIPNAALVFLWKAVRQGLRQEVERLIDSEGKKERPFFRCITERSDYRGLYPRGKMQGASPKLFVLYQTEVCGQSRRTLQLAHGLAHGAVQNLKPKDLKRFQREEAFGDTAIRNYFRSLMVHLAEQGDFDLADYIRLFQYSESDCGIEVRFDGWNLVRYYVHHADCPPEALNDDSSAESSLSTKFNTIRYYAAHIFADYVGTRGKAGFQSDVLNRMGRGAITSQWLQRQFVRLAEDYIGFTYEAWERLCKVSSVRVFVGELLFQMRLLWIQWTGQSDLPTVVRPDFGCASGLSRAVESCLKQTFLEYAERRGLNRFHRDILTRLRRKEIALTWFKHRLTREGEDRAVMQPFSEGDWESFLEDEEGHSCASERLFQMHLVLANLYREASKSKEEG